MNRPPQIRNFACLFFVTVAVSIGLAETEKQEPEPQVSGGLTLPVWEPEYQLGHFDTSLWPDGIVQQLEIEHLKFLVSDPKTDPEDRKMYQEIVNSWEARQRIVGVAGAY
ncbi:MAG: hypothetical protein HKN23_02015 [Verrucomicrobiales bacterium]|nr:hypothetical protein [Verrucomicrobiales bacterium]